MPRVPARRDRRRGGAAGDDALRARIDRPGRWEVVADGEPTRAICVADPLALTQVRHGAASCTRLVIASERTSATVAYTCPGAGWGRTSLRVGSSHAVRIDSQGVAESAPFAFAGKARRAGACDGTAGDAAVR